MINQVDEAEVDEMWSLVGKKKNQRWVWQAIDHRSGQVLMYVFGRRQDTVVVQLKTLLAPCGIRRSHTDHWGTYTRHLDLAGRSPGKRNTQQIERKHVTVRTQIKRLMRKTICLSRSIAMHDLVIGLYAIAMHVDCLCATTNSISPISPQPRNGAAQITYSTEHGATRCRRLSRSLMH